MNYRIKVLFHTFLLLVFVLIPKFIEHSVEIWGFLESQICQAVFDFILGPLKKVAEIGLIMSDPLDFILAKVPYRSLGSGTYTRKAKLLQLNGVHRPFWHDWPMAEPSLFLTQEILYHWFKFAYNHIVKWCIAMLGVVEIDFRFSMLRPHTGMHHFREGRSKAKHIMGHKHCDILQYLIPVIAEAKVISKAFITALTSIMYHGQASEIDEDILDQMNSVLATFHQYKYTIFKAGVRKEKNSPINNWHILNFSSL
ncbi:hypothetical protein B0H16DRAFT_1486050 [Mycena metata]|uniref:Uncharacterized protein n=1 Tax=Mycena metata TaxID=1033252 RepID=A0AAD7DJZ3_9AGAR|nr:hypothetical protein B0H16DRAFT_1486050 [Mycena metata]